MHLAAWKAKADIEWDLRFLSPLDKSWRGELMVLVWAIPVITLFLPWTRPYALSFFDNLKAFDPEAPKYYLVGWLLIFSCTFGMRQALSMLPGRYSKLVTALAGVQQDVPYYAADTAQEELTPSTLDNAPATEPEAYTGANAKAG